MTFTWKVPKDIWKGEGIYHLTFVVTGRRKLLGELVAIEESRAYSRSISRGYNGDVKRLLNTDEKTKFTSTLKANENAKFTSTLATTELSSFGFAVLNHLKELQHRYDEDALEICGKQFMPDHLHVVIWVKKGLEQSIRQIAQGFRIGVRKIANDMGVWNNEDGHPFEVPFIRTLSRKGQLNAMIRYVHANPDNAWRQRMNPDLYVIRRRQEIAGMLFDCMGKTRLLDYPDRQVVALARSLTKEQIESEVHKALRNAERGVVTYTAAMNEGEKAVAKAIREGGYPLVVMMLDGFPEEGTDAARYFHPSGVCHKACGDGQLYLMAPHDSNYENTELIRLTEAELMRKAEEKHQCYTSIPHTTTRWRMIAGNEMLKMIADN